MLQANKETIVALKAEVAAQVRKCCQLEQKLVAGEVLLTCDYVCVHCSILLSVAVGDNLLLCNAF